MEGVLEWNDKEGLETRNRKEERGRMERKDGRRKNHLNLVVPIIGF